MRRSRWLGTAVTILVTGVAVPGMAQAQTYHFSFAGPGIGGTLTLSYGSATDMTYPGAYKVTGISGSFSDSNHGLNLSNVSVDSLVPINHAAPEATNHLAPNDFSKFLVTAGLPPQSGGAVTFDNLFWPNGSPQTASDYPGAGGFLDIYGLFFGIGHGQYVNL